MSRKRSEKYAHLPANLHVLARSSGDYYTYHSPITKRSVSIGYDMEKAIRYAEEANLQLVARRAAKSHARASVKHGHIDGRGLLDFQTISSKAITYENVCGVYFLLRHDMIVYVGQSINVLTRIADHKREGAKIFDSIFIIQCKSSELCHLEALYIDKFKPRYNVDIPFVNPNAMAWDKSLSDILDGGV